MGLQCGGNFRQTLLPASWISPWLIPEASAPVFAADDLLYCAFYQYVIRYFFEVPF